MLLERVRDLSGVEVPGDPFYAGREAKAISNALAVADDRAPPGSLPRPGHTGTSIPMPIDLAELADWSATILQLDEPETTHESNASQRNRLRPLSGDTSARRGRKDPSSLAVT